MASMQLTKYRGSGVTPAVRRQVFRRDKDTCQYCDFPADEIDHVVPRIGGGSNTETNLVACCGPCNRLASDLIFDSFQEKREYVLSKRRPQIVGRRQASVLRGHVAYQRMLDDGRFDDGQLDMLVEDLGFPPETPEQAHSRWARKNATRRAKELSV